MMTFLFIFLFVVLFLFSSLFSASETALVSLSHYRLKKLMLKRKPLAGMYMSWLSAPQYILTTILIGNNVVNIAITTVATVAALEVFTDIEPAMVEGGVWLVLMVLLLIFGEITPKILGRRYPEAISLFVIRPLYIATNLLKPFIKINISMIKPFAFGALISPVKNVNRLTMEEIKRLIKESGEGGQVGKASIEMMYKVLSLNDMTISGIMTKFEDIEFINVERFHEKKVELIDEINEIGHTIIPVVSGVKDNVVGYINVKDIFIPADRGQELNLDAFIREPLFFSKSTKVADALKQFKSSGILIAVVKDENGKICGLVTLEDVLEEIVGEILDEYDVDIEKK